MRPDLETYYLIDQYLENKLKGEELTAFENQLKQDASFAKEVAEQRMLNNFILEAELKDLRTQIGKDLANIQNPSFFRMYWQWIGVGLLALSGLLYFSLSSKDDTAKTEQQSSAHPIEHTDPSVIEASKTAEQVSGSNKVETNKPALAAVSEVETTNPTNIAVIDSVHISSKEVITPAIIPAPISHAPTVESKTTEETKKTDCAATKITFSLATETTCENTETGSIQIDKISGGIMPYSFAVNNKKIKEKNISDLGAGTYEVKITDKNGCFTAHTATVSEKKCTPALQQGSKFNINPTIGETCNIPFDTDKKGNVTIYNRSGKIIYRATNPSSDSVEWTGTDGYGALAEAGLYVYIIEYTDGTKVTGEVNIIR